MEMWRSLLTSASDGGEWLTPCPGRFTLGKIPQHALKKRQRGPQSRSGGRVWRKESLVPLPGVEP
jgi:hypothetical protein